MSLAILCSHFNPAGFSAGRRNLMRFVRQMNACGIPVYIAELAYDDHDFLLPKSQHVLHYRTNRDNVLWHKENLLNLALQLVPAEYDKIAWIDPDIMFLSDTWFQDAVKALDHVGVVQLFSEAWWTNHEGFCFKQMRGSVADGGVVMGKNHPGFAWAARRDLWSCGGGLCELAILGGGDSVFGCACLGNEVPEQLYYPAWRDWTAKISTWVQNNGGCGYILGPVVHEWHGTDRNRAYIARHLLHRDLNIANSISRRPDGLLQFGASVSYELRSSFREYFGMRMEDGVGAPAATRVIP